MIRVLLPGRAASRDRKADRAPADRGCPFSIGRQSLLLLKCPSARHDQVHDMHQHGLVVLVQGVVGA